MIMAGGLFNLGMQSVKTFGAKNTLKGASAANKAINAGNKLGHVGVGTATGAVAGAAGLAGLGCPGRAVGLGALPGRAR